MFDHVFVCLLACLFVCLTRYVCLAMKVRVRMLRCRNRPQDRGLCLDLPPRELVQLGFDQFNRRNFRSKPQNAMARGFGKPWKNLETFIYLDVGKFKSDGLMNLPHEIRTTVLLSLGLQTRGCQEFDRSSRMQCIRLLGGFGRKFSSFLRKPCV